LETKERVDSNPPPRLLRSFHFSLSISTILGNLVDVNLITGSTIKTGARSCSCLFCGCCSSARSKYILWMAMGEISYRIV
jgi:hypothetical protein